ncbi:hypothetical protein LguiB_019510 [Lonicera macranthoides]
MCSSTQPEYKYGMAGLGACTHFSHSCSTCSVPPTGSPHPVATNYVWLTIETDLCHNYWPRAHLPQYNSLCWT